MWASVLVKTTLFIFSYKSGPCHGKYLVEGVVFEDLSMDGRIIAKFVLIMWGERVWTGLIW